MKPSQPGHSKESEAEEYHLATTPNFERAFRRLDEPVAQRVQKKLGRLTSYPQLAEPLRNLPPSLVGLHKYRVGDYRVLFWIDHSQKLITLYTVKHRSVVYKDL
ncbi:MAG: type II toxin-antitoxin system RelE family toxin [Terriglobia bacterium]